MIYNLPYFWYGRGAGFEFPFENDSLTEAKLEFNKDDNGLPKGAS